MKPNFAIDSNPFLVSLISFNQYLLIRYVNFHENLFCFTIFFFLNCLKIFIYLFVTIFYFSIPIDSIKCLIVNNYCKHFAY